MKTIEQVMKKKALRANTAWNGQKYLDDSDVVEAAKAVTLDWATPAGWPRVGADGMVCASYYDRMPVLESRREAKLQSAEGGRFYARQLAAGYSVRALMGLVPPAPWRPSEG